MIKRYCDRCGQQIDEGVHAWYVLELHGTDGEFRHKELCEECYEYLCEKDEAPKADRKTEPQTNAGQHVQHVGSVESVEPTWTKEEHEAFYTFLWNAINPNEMQDYIEMFETKDEPQTDIHDLTDCDFCKEKNCEDCEGGKDEPQTDCNGCKFVGTYDTEFPCANCSRKTKDHYAKDEPQTDCAWR